MTFKERVRWYTENISLHYPPTVSRCQLEGDKFYSKYEIRAFLGIIEPGNSISLSSIATQIEKLEKDTFYKTPAINSVLYSVIALLSRIETSKISEVNFCNCITSVDLDTKSLLSFTKLYTEECRHVERIFKKIKTEIKKSPTQAFGWCVRFLYEILSIQSLPEKWNEVIALMWFKRLLMEYCNIDMRFPFVDMMFRCLGKLPASVNQLSTLVKKHEINIIFDVIDQSLSNSELKIAGYPLDRLTPFQQALKDQRHDSKRIKQVEDAWENSSLKSAFADPDLYIEGTAGRDGVNELLRKAYVGLALERNYFEDELKKTGIAYLTGKCIVLPDFLELLNRGLQFYEKWELEECHLNKKEEK